MLPAASSFVPILVEHPRHPKSGMAYLFMSCSLILSSNRSKNLFLSFLFATALVGCIASSPRFRSKEVSNRTNQATRPRQQDASREAEEESRENDKKVEVSAILPVIDTVSVAVPAIDRRRVMDEILSMIGTSYSFNGTDSSGIDCSGFTARIYLYAMEKQLPHSTSDQFTMSKPVDDSVRVFGDLLFFNTTGESPSHVGIYLGENLFAHASVSNGVTISSLESSYYRKRYIGARRVIE